MMNRGMYHLQLFGKNTFFTLVILSCFCFSFNLNAQVNTFGASSDGQICETGVNTHTFTIPISAGAGTVTPNSVTLNFEAWHNNVFATTLQLCAPDGVTCAYIQAPSGGGNDLGNSNGNGYGGIYSFYDAAPNPFTSSTDRLPNTYMPQNSFSIFDGVAANGNWTLTWENTSASSSNDGCIRNVQMFLMYEIPCTDPTVNFTQISDCAGGGYQVQVDLTGTDGGNTIELTDGTSTTTVTVPGTYTLPGLFGGSTHYTGSETINVNGTSGGSLVCSAGSDSFVTPCNGSETCTASAPDITNISASADLTGATNENDDFGATAGACDNIRTCGTYTGISSAPQTNWEDIWYSIDNSSGTDDIDITMTGLTLPSSDGGVMVMLYSGCTSSDLISNGCEIFDASTTSFTFSGLAAYPTIYVRLVTIEVTSTNGASACSEIMNPSAFEISASVPQANDICGDAIDMEGITQNGNLCAASTDSDNNESGDACAEAQDANDLWYSVVIGASEADQNLTVTLDFVNASDAVVVSLYSGCNSNNWLECATVSSTGLGSSVQHTFTSVLSDAFGPSDNDYLIRVTPVAGNSVCNFGITGTTQLINDVCTGAATGGNTFDIVDGAPISFDFTLATDSDGSGNKDLWFIVENNDNKDVLISIANENNWDGEVSLVLYEYDEPGNADCDNLVEFCRVDNVSDCELEADCVGGETIGLDPDKDYLLRIVETLPDASGDQLAAEISGTLNSITVVANATCDGAINITNSSQTGEDLDNAGAPCGAEECLWYSVTIPDRMCGSSTALETSSVINGISVTFANAGTEDTGLGSNDGIAYLSLYNSDCSTQIGSTVNVSAGDGESETESFTGLSQGQDYFISICKYTSNLPETFDISASLDAVAPCNDDPANAEGLSVNDCLNYTLLETWSAGGATETAPVDGAPESDVWFSFVAPSPANGGTYFSGAASWVTVFFEAVSGEQLTLELYNTPSTQAPGTSAETASGAGGQQWAQFGNLVPGQTYYLRLYHKQLASVDVQYKIGITTGPGEEPGWGCGKNSYSNAGGCSGGCGDLREQWFKIDLPDGTPGNEYWVIEVFGYDEWLDFELRSKYLDGVTTYDACSGTEAATEGTCADFDHPCSSVALESAVSIDNTTVLPFASDLVVESAPSSCDDSTTPGREGRGIRRVYFNMNGAVAGAKDYYYLRVFMDPASPNYATATDIHICQLNFAGPYDSAADANAGGDPNLECAACDITDVQVGTDGTCNGNNAEFTLNFDVTDGSGDYEIVATAANATYGINIGDVLGTITAAGTSGTNINITGVVNNPTMAGVITVDVRDTNDNLCEGGTGININIPVCSSCVADNGTFDDTGFTTLACDGSGTFDVSTIWTSPNTSSHTQQYIQVGSDAIIDIINSTGSFTITTPGTYTFYAINTEDGNEPTNLSVGNTLADLNDGCFDLDELTESIEVTVNPTITVTPTADSEVCSADNTTYSYSFTVTGGSGTYSSVVSSDGYTITDNGGGSYTVAGIPSGTTTTITVTDDLGCTNSPATQVPAMAVNCCGAFIGNFPSGN